MELKLGKCKLYIFDLEGTLIHIPVDWGEVDQRLETLMGIPPKPYQKNISVLPIKEKMKAFRIVDYWERKAFKNASINYRGVQYLKKVSKECPVVIATLSGRAITKRSLKRLKITNNVSMVITRNDKYPRNKQLKYILNMYKLSPDEVIFVGDRDMDLLAANHAKCNYKDVSELG